MPCDKCGQDGPLYRVNFRRNIGLLVMHLTKTFNGDFCKGCVKSIYWSTFFTNLFLGWWGIKSFFLTGYFLFDNTVQFLGLAKQDEQRGRL